MLTDRLLWQDKRHSRLKTSPAATRTAPQPLLFYLFFPLHPPTVVVTATGGLLNAPDVPVRETVVLVRVASLRLTVNVKIRLPAPAPVPPVTKALPVPRPLMTAQQHLLLIQPTQQPLLVNRVQPLLLSQLA